MIAFSRCYRGLRGLFALAGLFWFAFVLLPLTPYPWRWYAQLGQPASAFVEPDVLVMMGGGGIPSESGLMRSWKTAEAASIFPSARIIIAIPREPEEMPPGPIERELLMRGVVMDRLAREPQGRNTREQAVEVVAMLRAPDGSIPTIGLITSPEHMMRTWLSFKKAGAGNLVAIPSWPEAIKADLDYRAEDLGGRSIGSMVGGSNLVKYKYFDNLGILNRCVREWFALGYYKLMGWI